MIKCPGQDQRYWKPEDIFDISCPNCNEMIEFFKDEPKLECPKCKQTIINPKIDFGCTEWCKYAEKCTGNLSTNVKNTKREDLIKEMKRIFGSDQKRIEHALSVLNFAEQIQKIEGGDLLIVRAAAILHDIGIHEAEQKHGSSAGNYQEIEGPPLAEQILKENDIPSDDIEHICRIIANHHSAKNIDTIEFRIIWDADWLVNIPVELPNLGWEKLQKIIGKTFKTPTGHKIATELFLGNSSIVNSEDNLHQSTIKKEVQK